VIAWRGYGPKLRNRKKTDIGNNLVQKQAIVALLAIGVATLGAIATPACAEEPDFISISAGVFDINDTATTAEFRVEYRSDLRFWHWTPFVGLMGTADSALYGYAGLGFELFFGPRVVITPNAAFGAYADGDGKDLGSTIEFRTGLELAYRFDDYSRLGLAFHHISNASIDENNPGTESLVLTYSIPLYKFY
jgi:lipid A 3-O-deacylase